MRGFLHRHRIALLTLITLLALAAFPKLLDAMRAEARTALPLGPGVLLVARPGSGDGLFRETVVLLVEAGGEHTWGLVLNRPEPPRGGALPSGAQRWGGPVDPERRTTLFRAQSAAPPGARALLDGLSWREGAVSDANALTFAGLAGWSPGQLEAEVEAEGWWVVEGSAASSFADPRSMWAECLARHL
ncbi:YqgE/AlgH family protein [Myxococcaceae bacterium GXIMD 01537]